MSHPAPSGQVDPTTPSDDGIEHEQRYVSMLYERLDARRAETARRLHSVLHDETPKKVEAPG